VGSVWTWTAVDADTKLVASWTIGTRDADSARTLMLDLAGRLRHRIQLTTDGHKAYLEAVDEAFGGQIDYAMLVKIYGESENPEKRYSPASYTGARISQISGNPDDKHISTSYVGRQNLTMRMQMRRFTRLTNAFSKKLENHIAAISLHFMFYNFVRIHQTLKVTPAMAAGVTDRVWEIADVVSLLEAKEEQLAQAKQARKSFKDAKIGLRWGDKLLYYLEVNAGAA
jgi:IS1 family transposase